MNHLIIRTHYGTNLKIIKDFLLNKVINTNGWVYDYETESYIKIDIDAEDLSNVFFRFIEQYDLKSFKNQYEEDKKNNLIAADIPIESLNENNWNSTFSDIINLIENSYIKTLKNEWFIYIIYTYPFVIKNKDKAKTIWILRNPTMSWAYKQTISSPKKLFYDIKMISNEYINEIEKWSTESIYKFNIPLKLRAYLQSFDIENMINFIFMFLLISVRPTKFSINSHIIQNTQLQEIILIIKERLDINLLKTILKTSKNLPKIKTFEYDGNYDNIFTDSNIIEKMEDLSSIFNIILNRIPDRNKQTYINLIQNFMYSITKINRFWDIFNDKTFMQQNLNKDFLINLDDESYNWFLNLLTKINIDKMLEINESGKLEDPRKNPLIINDIKNPRPNENQTSDEFKGAYFQGYEQQLTDIQLKLEELGLNDGFNKLEKIESILFSNGFFSGFTDGFNDGANAKQKKTQWNSLISEYNDGYGYGYDKAYPGGVSLLNTPGQLPKQQITLYYNGLKEGIFDSINDLNQKIYNYNYECGFYDKRIIEFNSGIGEDLTNAVKFYIHSIIKNPIKDKLLNYEDLIQPKAVETLTSIMRFFYLYYLSDNTYFKDINENDIPSLIIKENLAFLDLKLFLGQENIPEKIMFQRKNNWLTYEELFNKNSNKFTNYVHGWQDEEYLGTKYKDKNQNLNTFELLNKRLNFDLNTWLYEGNRHPDQFDKNTK